MWKIMVRFALICELLGYPPYGVRSNDICILFNQIDFYRKLYESHFLLLFRKMQNDNFKMRKNKFKKT